MEEISKFSSTNLSKLSSALMIGAGTMFLVWYVQYLWKRRFLYIYASKLPGPFSLPVIGMGYLFVGSNADIFDTIGKYFKQYPNIYRAWLGTDLFFCISDPRYAEKIMTQCLGKSDLYRFVEPVVGHGIFTAPVNVWKKHRRTVMTTFNQKILDRFVEVFTQQTNIAIQLMEKFNGKGEFDIFHSMTKLTLDSVCETIVGTQVNAQTTESLFPKWIKIISTIAFKRICSVWYHYDIVFNNSKLFQIFNDFSTKARNFTGAVVREKMEAYEEEKRRKLHGEEFIEDEFKRKPLLDHLIEIGDKEKNDFTAEQILNEVITLIVAGSDTLATSTCFTLLIMGMYPEIQAKVLDEVLKVVGPDRDPEYSDLPHLKYLDMVVKESLRLFPSAPLIGRSVDKDVNLGQYIIPKGSSILVSILAVHTNEKYWPDPYKFIPERFLPEEVAKRHPWAYMPFSQGPRNCTGPRYAMMSAKTTLAMIVRKFKLFTSYKSIEEINLESNITLSPKDGYKLSLELR